METAITGAIGRTGIIAVLASGNTKDSGSIFIVRTTGPITIIIKGLTAVTTIITAETGIQATAIATTIRAMTGGIPMATTTDTGDISRVTIVTE
jgi:hypothetical protein